MNILNRITVSHIIAFALGTAVTYIFTKVTNKKNTPENEECYKTEMGEFEKENNMNLKKEDIDILNRSEFAKRAGNYTPINEPEIVESRPYRIRQSDVGDVYDDLYSYTYYLGDETLVGDDGQPLLPVDIAENVGFENLNFYDEDIIYIRNEVKGCDYEITAVDERYDGES